MSCNKTEVGLLISREPDGLQQQQPQQQLEGATSPISSNNNNNNNNNNNDGEKIMICENHKSSSSLEKIGLREPTSDTNVRNAELSRDSSAKPTGHINNAHEETQRLEGLREDSSGTGKSDAPLHGASEDDRVKNLFRKYKLSIKNETVIVSRIDGILDSTGERSSLYKCHLCGKLGGTLEKLRRHLAAHSRKLPYRCRLCDVRFQLRPQLSFHLKTQHGSFWVGSLEAEHSTGHPATGSSLKALQVDPVTSREDVRINGSSRRPVPGVSTLRQSSDELDSSGTEVLEPPSKVAALEDAIVGRKNFDFGNVNSVSSFQGQSKLYSFQELTQSRPISYASSSDTLNGNAQPTTVHSDPLKELSDRELPLFTCRQSKESAERGAFGIREKTPVQMLGNEVEYDQSQGMDMTCKPSRLRCPPCEPKNGSCSNIAVLAPELFTVDLASKIRETEHLGDDITVVIPSDAPIEETEAPCDVVRPGEDSEAACQNKIIHAAPHKSILGNAQLRTKRKLSASATTPTSSSSADSLPPRVGHQNNTKHPAECFSSHQMSVASGVSSGSLPLSVYNPLALSSFVQGFNGLMSSSLLSPIITQASLGFPGMLVNPLSLYAAQLSSSSIASLMNSKVANLSVAAAAAASLDCSIQRDLATSSNGAQPDSLHLETLVEGANRVKEELSNSSGSGGCLSSTSEGYASPNSKCSSLSRTHSRLNVIQKPIKRENAYKPIIMSDGRTAYHCLYCNKNFCTISDVNRHMDFHEGEEGLVQNCSSCGLLKQSCKCMPPERCSYIRPYKCRFCNYYARTNSQLKVHMMRHQGIRDFLCRLCNYKGVTQSDLNRHTKSQIHMMKERNVCTLCREGFVSPMNLEQHHIEKHLKMESCNDGGGSTGGVKYHLTMAGLVKENASN